MRDSHFKNDNKTMKLHVKLEKKKYQNDPNKTGPKLRRMIYSERAFITLLNLMGLSLWSEVRAGI